MINDFLKQSESKEYTTYVDFFKRRGRKGEMNIECYKIYKIK